MTAALLGAADGCEHDAKGRALTPLGFDVDARVVVADDAVDNRQTEPGPLAEGAAEWLENALDLVRRNANAVIGDGEHTAKYAVDVFTPRAQIQGAPVWHRPKTVGG